MILLFGRERKGRRVLRSLPRVAVKGRFEDIKYINDWMKARKRKKFIEFYKIIKKGGIREYFKGSISKEKVDKYCS